MNEIQKKVLRNWTLGIIAAVTCGIWGVGIIFNNPIAVNLFLVAIVYFIFMMVVYMVMDWVYHWRLLGECDTEADRDIKFWYKYHIANGNLEQVIGELMMDERSPMVLQKEDELKTLRRFSAVKRPKFLWFRY